MKFPTTLITTLTSVTPMTLRPTHRKYAPKEIYSLRTGIGQCGSLLDFLQENADQDTSFDNYKIKIKRQRVAGFRDPRFASNLDGITPDSQNRRADSRASSKPIAYMSCKKLLKNADPKDREGRLAWERHYLGREKYGRYDCIDGNWIKVWDYPICPDRMVTFEWYNFAVMTGLIEVEETTPETRGKTAPPLFVPTEPAFVRQAALEKITSPFFEETTNFYIEQETTEVGSTDPSTTDLVETTFEVETTNVTTEENTTVESTEVPTTMPETTEEERTTTERIDTTVEDETTQILITTKEATTVKVTTQEPTETTHDFVGFHLSEMPATTIDYQFTTSEWTTTPTTTEMTTTTEPAIREIEGRQVNGEQFLGQDITFSQRSDAGFRSAKHVPFYYRDPNSIQSRLRRFSESLYTSTNEGLLIEYNRLARKFTLTFRNNDRDPEIVKNTTNWLVFEDNTVTSYTVRLKTSSGIFCPGWVDGAWKDTNNVTIDTWLGNMSEDGICKDNIGGHLLNGRYSSSETTGFQRYGDAVKMIAKRGVPKTLLTELAWRVNNRKTDGIKIFDLLSLGIRKPFPALRFTGDIELEIRDVTFV